MIIGYLFLWVIDNIELKIDQLTIKVIKIWGKDEGKAKQLFILFYLICSVPDYSVLLLVEHRAFKR